MSNNKGYYYARDIGGYHMWDKNNGDIYNKNLTGRVGINTKTPAYTLDVSGDTNIKGSLYINGSLLDLSGSSPDLSGYVRNPMRSNLDASGFSMTKLKSLLFGSGSTISQGTTFDLSLIEHLKVNNNGLVVNTNNRVGINIGTPAYTLDVSGDTNIKGSLYINGNSLSNIDLSGYVRNPMRSNLDASGFSVTKLKSLLFGSGSTISQGTTFDLSLIEQLKVNNNGLVVNTNNRVGINTGTPAYTLDVSGDTNIKGSLYVNKLVASDTSGIIQLDLSNYVKNPLDKTFDLSKNNLINMNNLEFYPGFYIYVDKYPGSYDGKVPIFNNDSGPQPICIMRTTYIKSDISYSIANGSSAVLKLTNTYTNQLHLELSNNTFKMPLELSGQFIEIYASVQIDTGNNNNVLSSADISCNQCNYKNIFDSNQTFKAGIFNIVYGPHLIRPDEFDTNNRYSININNNSGSNVSFKVLKSDLVMRSYLI